MVVDFSFEVSSFPNTRLYSGVKKKSEYEPIVFDFGSYMTRVGYATEIEPQLSYESVINKFTYKDNAKSSFFGIGNEYHDNAVKQTVRSPFDGNLIYQYDYLETMMDVSLLRLGVSSLKDTPLVVTEPACNFNAGRKQLNELVFEAYNAPRLMCGIDFAFSYFYNNPDLPDGMIVSGSHLVTHVVPFINGRLDMKNCKRLNIGGNHLAEHFLKLLQLKYPLFPVRMNLSQAQKCLFEYGYVADNYREESLKFLNDPERSVVIQFPFASTPDENNLEEEMKREQREKEKELTRQARIKRLAEKEKEFNEMKSMKEELEKEYEMKQQEEEEEDAIDQVLEENQEETSQPPPKKAKKTIQISFQDENNPIISYFIEKGFNDLKQVKTRIMRLKEAITKLKKKISENDQEEKSNNIFESLSIQDLQEKRNELISKIREKKFQMNGRKNQQSKQRMRNLAQLAGSDPSLIKNKKKKIEEENVDDGFGQRDSDWHVYLEINKETNEGELEDFENMLEEIEDILDRKDPSFSKDKETILSNLGFQTKSEPSLEEKYQLSLSTERIRTTESLFHPSFIGLDQAGISEIIESLFKTIPIENQINVAQNVFLTGTHLKYKNIQSRIERDLRMLRPSNTNVCVKSASDMEWDAWKGAAKFSLERINDNSCWLTKKEYEEMGDGYLKEHACSNWYYQIPQ
ncbi:actin-like ATPase domain-containing protein [Rozella allomycis CSF55]|uniref:Actin-like ATPase domain-containing protein n=1 Tax=Rozella allomycis (strain CSF55) TaxID=988480 RepID=A0A075AZD0_ROZAC|nr:Actin-related protein domain-containing protein [Rozella allomycis CSF55]RKP19387.1 actin-like ATPase domain-containing protein [Rozella allomycis CSF55]|eukprot:EPZ35650.1 Actin-related protein domain-containing protein [Rozella allomycis CSF55]